MHQSHVETSTLPQRLPSATVAGPGRRALAGGALAVLMGTAAARAAPVAIIADAELIGVCAEFIACDQARRAIFEGPSAIPDDDEAEAAAIPHEAHLHTLLDDMQRLRATTAAGVLARAQVLAQHAGDFSFSFDYRSTKTGRLLDYLLRDAAALAGEQGEALPYVPPQSPDAKVIALCGEHDVLERRYQAVLAVRTVEQELEVEAEADAIQVALGPIVERIAADPPTTAEGWRAVAGSLVLSHPETISCGSGCNDELLLTALLCGLLGRA